MTTDRSRIFLILALTAPLAFGCATKKFVRAEVGGAEERSGTRVTAVESQIEEAQDAIAETKTQVGQQGQQIEQQSQQIQNVSKTAQDALERALAAGKLAEGRLVSETVLSSDAVKFPFQSSQLSDEAKAALDAFAAPLKAENRGVFVEIQGHTDASGEETYNLQLGEERAEAVRRHLNQAHEFPLHRMSVISYGETEPAYENTTLEGRKKNRRVVLVVLR
jgi:outer membrane protein OmpA-like peptidoglycan-associated protein